VLRQLGSLVFLLAICSAAPLWASSSLTFQGYVQTLNTGGSISLSSPAAVAVDASGNIFIADTSNNQIVEVNAQGAASVLTISGLSSALSSPKGIAIDGSGNLYIADTGNSRVVMVSPSGGGSVIATGSVTLSSPQGVALDQSGDIFIADTGNNQIVEVTSGGSAAALAITVSSSPASLSSPKGLAVDVSGNLYIADSTNNRIVTVAAGSTTGVVLSSGGLVPGLSGPSSVAVDRIGNVYIADTGHNRITELDTAGNGNVLLNTIYLQGTTLSGPLGVAVDVFGGVYIADTGASRALIVYPYLDADPETLEGYTSSLNKSAVGFGHIQLGSSNPTSLTLNFTTGAETGLGGVNVFTSGTQGLDFQIVSGANTTCTSTTEASASCSVQISFLPTAPGLRKGALVLYDTSLKPVLTLPLYAFSDTPVAALAPNIGTVIGTGSVALNFPFQLAVDGAGNIYDANDGGNLVKITAGGSASVVPPGSLTFGSEVTGAALDGAGNLFISDHTNSRIIVLAAGGSASVLSISGLGSTGLNHPTGLAFDGAGNLYISDWVNGRIVEVSCLKVLGLTSSGIGTVIGTGGYVTSSQGITGVAVDSMGNIYIPDGYNGTDPSRIIKVTSAGVASLLTPTGISFRQPRGVSVDGMGNIYVADGGNNRIVEITSAGVASVLVVNGLPTPSTLGSPFGVTIDPFGNLYIPDSGNNRIVFVNVSGASLAFPTTAKGITSAAKTATVTNLGNQPLVFSTDPTYTADFSVYGGDTNPCTSSTILSAGSRCDVPVNFSPQSVGNLSAGITVTNNTLNVAGSTQQISVSGTSYSQGDTTSVAVSAVPSAVPNGQAITITATVSDTTAGHTATVPTGSVTFMDTIGSTTVTLNGGASVSLSAGTATLTGVVLSGTGTHTITANYAGVSGTFLQSSKSTSVLVKPIATVAVSSSANPSVFSSAVTFTASVASSSGSPTGTVTFFDAATQLGTATLSSGAATFSTSTLSAGSHSITVVYAGDASFGGNTSNAITQTVQDFNFTVNGGTATVVSAAVNPGGSAVYTIQFSPQGGSTFASAVALTLTGLPAGATYTITPSTIQAGSSTTTVTVTVNTTKQQTAASLIPHKGDIGFPKPLMLAMFLPMLGARKLRHALRVQMRTSSLMLMMLGVLLVSGMTACGNGSGFLAQTPQTYPMTLTGTSGALHHSVTLNLTVQ
jgi:sugar lactone lactonase YvrE